MAKQAIGSSTDRWQRPPSRGSGLLPLPSYGPSAIASSSGLISDVRRIPPVTHQHLAYQGRGRLPGQTGRKSGSTDRENPMSPSGGMNTERDRSRERGSGGRGTSGGQGMTQQPTQGTSGDITATAIVHQHDLETIEGTCSRNPLLCLVCNNVFEDPRLLGCYHSFCSKCLPPRNGDGKLICPLCGKPTSVKDSSGPPPDHLLRYLLHATPHFNPSCANCDNKSRAPMFYCNTCGQVLCIGCREETHRAKMFSTHDIIPVSKYTKETPKKCSVHGEQFIMFSTLHKQMLCIHCYRDTAMESRLHCVDLETAYGQGCRKLERAVLSLRDLQLAVRDGITMLKNILEELRRNTDSEKSAVHAVCQTILDALTKTQENLLKDVDCQMEGKDKVIRGQLSQLRSVLPTIRLHLAMCATLGNTTNKYDFLDLAYPLIDRLTAITHMGYPIRPAQSGQIKSMYKQEIARTLEPWVAGPHREVGISHLGPSKLHKEYAQTTADEVYREPTYSQYYPMSRSTVTPGHKPPPPPPGYAAPTGIDGVGPSGRKTPVARPKVEVSDDHFAVHCRSFAAHVNELNQRLSRLKEQVQELHRDITLQRGSAHAVRTENALREGLFLEDQLERRHAEMERIRKHLESQWSDSIRQIRTEQEVFQAQMNDLLSMKSEVKQVSSLVLQLQAFLKSLGVHPPSQPPTGSGGGGGGGGPSGGGGGGPSGQSFGGPGGPGRFGGGPPGSGGGHGPIQSGQSTTQHSLHATKASDAFSRADMGSQVTPSLAEMGYMDMTKGLGGRGRPTVPHRQTGFVSRPGFQPKHPSHAGSDYIEVDPSYTPGRLVSGIPPLDTSGRKGMLSQLMSKVRSKDDRKKSTVSTSSSGVPQPQQQGVFHFQQQESASVLPSRRGISTYDAQCQFGLDSSTSAVSALALASSNLQRAGAMAGYSSQPHESRPSYHRTKSFVKSKSDDERPPNKLAQQRARSASQLETESLLRSLSSGTRDASKIVELYQSLSKTIMERENQRESYPQNYNQYVSLTGTIPPKSTGGTYPYGQSNSLGRIHSKSPPSPKKVGEGSITSEDDYQLLPFSRDRSHPIERSHSAPPRKAAQSDATGGRGGGAEVKVFVHEEPGTSTSRARSSPPFAPVSKSLEESYLYSYLSQPLSGGLTSSSSGQSGFGTTFTTLGKKPASCESLASGTPDVETQNSRKSSIDFDRRSVVTVKRAGSKPALITRQHSWEAGAVAGTSLSAAKREHSLSSPQLSPTADDPFGSGRSSAQSEGDVHHTSRMYDEDDLVVGSALHKADSFEGHEEAVRSIVAAVQETRTLQRRLQSN